jgi:hypothetical protein
LLKKGKLIVKKLNNQTLKFKSKKKMPLSRECTSEATQLISGYGEYNASIAILKGMRTVT